MVGVPPGCWLEPSYYRDAVYSDFGVHPLHGDVRHGPTP